MEIRAVTKKETKKCVISEQALTVKIKLLLKPAKLRANGPQRCNHLEQYVSSNQALACLNAIAKDNFDSESEDK